MTMIESSHRPSDYFDTSNSDKTIQFLIVVSCPSVPFWCRRWVWCPFEKEWNVFCGREQIKIGIEDARTRHKTTRLPKQWKPFISFDSLWDALFMVRHAWERDLHFMQHRGSHHSLPVHLQCVGSGTGTDRHRYERDKTKENKWINANMARLYFHYNDDDDNNGDGIGSAAKMVKHHTICNFKEN